METFDVIKNNGCFEISLSRGCATEKKTGRKFFVSFTMLQGKRQGEIKLTRIKVDRSVDVDQSRADFSPVNSLVGADQDRAKNLLFVQT